MFRRVLNWAAKAAGRGAGGSNLPLAVAATPSAEAEAQREILKEAVRELSHGMSKPMQLSPADTLNKWATAFRGEKEKELSTEQLEELGRALYEGAPAPEPGGTVDLPKDEVLAVQVWRCAALRGSIEASYSLAVCIREGRGCAKDSKDAFERMLELAEKKNYHLAHYAVAIMLTTAEAGGQPDHVKAFHHFKAAAKGGVMPALHNIANAYAAGRGVKQSDYNAMLYYQAAADAGDPHAMFSLAGWLHTGRATEGGKKFPEKAFQYNLQAAHLGHPAAMFNVGAAFMSGIGTGEGKDYVKAAGWFEKASYEGTGRIVEASINLGNMYRQGLGVPRDQEKAKAIFQKCAPFNSRCASILQEMNS